MTINATDRHPRSAIERRITTVALVGLAVAALAGVPAEAAQRNVMMEYFTNLF
jgi:hypothetical protein